MELTTSTLALYQVDCADYPTLVCTLYADLLLEKGQRPLWEADLFEFNYHTWRVKMPKATFVSTKLDKKQITELKKWVAERSDDFETLEGQLIVEGYKVSLKYSHSNESFVYTVTPADYKYGQAAVILSRFHSELWKARAEALFIHFHLTSGKWADLVEPEGDAW